MRTLPWYNINHALSVELGLRGAELQIYSALKVLTSKDGSWKGTANELEDSALTGKGEDTITNIVKKLALRGLFKADIKKGLGISIDFPKNSEALPKNSEVHPKNSEVPKESNKENNNNLIMGEGDISRTPAHDLGGNNSSKNNIWDRPATWQECRDYCYQFHGTKETYEKFYRHYEATGWFGIKNWRAKLRNWIVEDTKRDMLELQRQQRYDPNYR